MRVRIRERDGKINLGDDTGLHAEGEEFDARISWEQANRLEQIGEIDILEQPGVAPKQKVEPEPVVVVDDPTQVCCGTCGLYTDQCTRNGRKYRPETQGCTKYWRPKA